MRLQALIRSRILSHKFKHLRGHIIRLQARSRGADVAECSVVDNIAAEVNLDEVGEVLEDGDEELGVDVGGAGQRQGAEAPAPLLQQGDGVVDGSWLDLKMTDLGLDEDMKVVSSTSPSADDAENTTLW